jgi:uncharacterized protein (DUF1778 family)
MNQFPIDIDAETVNIDGRWYTREELAASIRQMLDGGNFNVATPSAALQELTLTVQSIRTLNFRVTPDFDDALNQFAARVGKSVSQLVRESLTQHMTQALSHRPSGVHQLANVQSATAQPTVVIDQTVSVADAATAPAKSSAGEAKTDGQRSVVVDDSVEARWFNQ